MPTPSKTSGLDALIPKGNEVASGYREIPVKNIQPNRNQPRQSFTEEELDSLVASVQIVGILQPIAVRPIGDDMFELISGERRWRASKKIGLEFIPAVIRQINDEGSLEHALIENIHRTSLNPLEEAAGYQHLIDEFDLTQDEVAKRVGKNRATITNSLRLIKLPPEIQAYIVSGEITSGHARSLVSINNTKQQIALAKRIVKENWTVRQLEAYRQKMTGKGQAGSKKDPAKGQVVLELEEFLANKLSTRVSISLGSKGVPGKAVIEFADLEDLERIVSGFVSQT